MGRGEADSSAIRHEQHRRCSRACGAFCMNGVIRE